MTDRIFNLDFKFNDPLRDALFAMAKGPIEHVLAFPRMNKAYAEISRMQDDRPFADKVLDRLQVSYDLAAEDRARMELPSGPLVVVSNHPFGGIEALILASILGPIRRDLKFLANHLLQAIPEMRELFIPVNPFQGNGAIRQNIKPVRESIRWVKHGGALIVFPAGTVSHFDPRKGEVTDPRWNPGIARIIRKTGASVLPVFFRGSNSAAFHLAGMVHPLLRTVMLPNEQLNKGRRTIEVRAGDVISLGNLAESARDEDVMEYLRLRTYMLGQRHARRTALFLQALPVKKPGVRSGETILQPRNSVLMRREIGCLAPSQTLAVSGDLSVIQARADQIPQILLEIGRLRELTFRAAGEGTGKAVDLDRFDHAYHHLFIWNGKNDEVVGAYRLGRTDELVKRYGISGLYTSTLFRYKAGFIDRLGPALELGRSFVRPEYQKSFSPLLLLWKGIGRFVVENPYYRTLFGPVSIADDYQQLSKQIIVKYLETTRYHSDMAALVRPRKPLRAKGHRTWDIDAAVRTLQHDIEDVSGLVSSLERDGKGIPILLKQYVRLGGRIAGFNIDPAFGNALDGLIIVDLLNAERRALERYMGKTGLQQFIRYHEAISGDRLKTCA